MSSSTSARAGGNARSLSTGTKLGILGRVAVRQAGNSRLAKATFAAARGTISSLARAGRLLWLQVTGLLFVAFAIVGAVACVRESRAYLANTGGLGRPLLAFLFTLLFAWFGVSSFWRASRK